MGAAMGEARTPRSPQPGTIDCDRARLLVRRAPFGIPFRDEELLHILRRHPRFREKTRGRSVVALVKRRNTFGGYTLFLVLDDGGEVDISWRKACRDEDEPLENKVIRAFRRAVTRDILMVKRAQGSVHGYEAHHVVPFRSIVEEFLRRKNLRFEDVEIAEAADGGYMLRDRGLAEEFRRFHSGFEVVVLPRWLHRVLHAAKV